MSNARLAHAFVFVADVQRMVAFYESALGWFAQRTPDADYVVMRAPDGEGAGVALHGLPAGVTAPLTDPPRWREDAAYKITFLTDDLDGLRKAILAHGGQAKDPWTWNSAIFCECADPEGNAIQLLQPATLP